MTKRKHDGFARLISAEYVMFASPTPRQPGNRGDGKYYWLPCLRPLESCDAKASPQPAHTQARPGALPIAECPQVAALRGRLRAMSRSWIASEHARCRSLRRRVHF